MPDEVAFDLRSAGGSPTGVGRHLLSIVQAVAEHRPDIPLRAYVRGDVAGLPERVDVVRIGSGGPLWHLRTWRHLRQHPVRAYCSTSLLIPALTGVPCLPVIFDVISFLYPEHHTRRTKLFERAFMGRVVRRRPLLVGSETTREDVERLFGRCRAEVVTPWVAVPRVAAGAGERPGAESAPDQAPALDRYGIRGPYALYIGTVEPRKNVTVAVEAVEKLRAEGRDIRLAVVGARGWIDRRTGEQLDAGVAAGSVVMTGYIPDDDRDALLAGAACLVLPSIYEGFGLPVLEAMAHGVPCVCSTARVFEEVAGDAAIHVDPKDATAWAQNIARILDQPEVGRALVEAGRARASDYSSDETARRFAVGLEQLV